MKTPSDEKLMKSFILQFTGRGQDMRQPEKCQRHYALVVCSASVQVPVESAFGEKDCSTSLVELLCEPFCPTKWLLPRITGLVLYNPRLLKPWRLSESVRTTRRCCPMVGAIRFCLHAQVKTTNSCDPRLLVSLTDQGPRALTRFITLCLRETLLRISETSDCSAW